MTEGDDLTLSDIRDEAVRIATAAQADGLAVRLFGGLAIWLRCPSVRQGPFARDYADVDFAVGKSSATKLKALLEANGYLPDKFFNGMHGATRLYYRAPDGRWSVDVIIDELVMSHTLDLRASLAEDTLTIPLADLLLSKLQVWEITPKDLGDATCILADHRAGGPGDIEAFDIARIQDVLGANWGFCHTVERNLGKVAELWAQQPLPEAPCDVAEQVASIRRAIEDAPKSRAWKLRARVGERVRWYETPEEAKH